MVLDGLRSRRVLAGSAIVLAGLLSGPLMPRHALALYSSCRADPKVYLSNGSMVTLTATISDSATDVSGVQYTLHAPAGTSVTNVVYTGGSFAGKERLSFYADDPANTYDSATLVGTHASNIAVTASTQVNTPKLSGSSSGYNDQHLTVHL